VVFETDLVWVVVANESKDKPIAKIVDARNASDF
jgi:hypothetical protein